MHYVFRSRFSLCCLLVLLLIPLNGCSEKITPPQETVFNFLDQILRGDPQLFVDSYNYIDHSLDPQRAKEFQKTLYQRAAQMSPTNEGYIQKVFLIAENHSKPQTADVSSQYLRVPDLFLTQEVELKRVNGSWKLTEQSAYNILQNILSPTFKQPAPTPDAGKWHEAKIYVSKRFTDYWAKETKLAP